jgi:hypothetical protein
MTLLTLSTSEALAENRLWTGPANEIGKCIGIWNPFNAALVEPVLAAETLVHGPFVHLWFKRLVTRAESSIKIVTSWATVEIQHILRVL